jgi:hypothetical protein
MLHPTVLADLAREHQADLYRSAEQHRLARAALVDGSASCSWPSEAASPLYRSGHDDVSAPPPAHWASPASRPAARAACHLVPTSSLARIAPT